MGSEGAGGGGEAGCSLEPWTCGPGVGMQVGAATLLPYPDILEHLHGRKGLEGTDETLWVTEASNDVWDPQKE